MTQRKATNYWRESANRNLTSAVTMVDANHRDWGLFVGQLALEKLLKGLIAKRTNDAPPFSHDLVFLAHQAQLTLSQEQTDQLAAITRFNIEARYNSIKDELYKKATPAFTTRWITVIKTLFLWIDKQF